MNYLLIAAIGISSVLAQHANPLPNPKYTVPTVASTSQVEVCSVVGGKTYSQRHRLSQTSEAKKKIFEEYGIPYSYHKYYEDDHDLELALGGSDSLRNRWPEPEFGTWNAKVKDRLERRAWYRVCKLHNLTLSQAQSWFLTDWRQSYCKEYPKFQACDKLQEQLNGK